jgi:hypothetical protein
MRRKTGTVWLRSRQRRLTELLLQSMYSAVNKITAIGKVVISEADVAQACMPPRETPASSATVPAVRSPPASTRENAPERVTQPREFAQTVV